MLIPLYSYPNWYDPGSYIWDDVAAAASQISVTAVINPSNGPGDPPNADYQLGISDLRDAGVTTLDLPRCWALQMRVSISPSGSVTLIWNSPSPVPRYQLDLTMPGISPCEASSRSAMRDIFSLR